MSEYIDKSKAVGEGYLQDWYISSVVGDVEPVWTEAHIDKLANDFIVIPKDMPAADVAPVVHGRWVHSPSPYDKRDDFWFCSECGRTINIICGDKLLSNYPYCHCGAKMDGGDTDV